MADGLTELRLRGFYAQTDLDGNKEAYGQMLGDYLGGAGERHAAMQGRTPTPAPDAFGMEEFAWDAKRGTGTVPPHTLKKG